ncbi:MAG: hypothetical protein ACK4SJ_06175 [Sphingorhabdus sp.]
MNRPSECDAKLARKYACQIAGLLDEPEQGSEPIEQDLVAIINRYRLNRRRFESIGHLKQLKRDLKKTISQLEKVIDGYMGLGPDVLIAIEAIRDIRRGVEHGDEFLAPASEFAATLDAMRHFLAKLETKQGRPVDSALEALVCALLGLAERHGLAVDVGLDKQDENRAIFRTPMARILAALLRCIDRAITETSLVNMIVKIRSGSAGKPTPYDKIIETCLSPFECEFLAREDKPV